MFPHGFLAARCIASLQSVKNFDMLADGFRRYARMEYEAEDVDMRVKLRERVRQKDISTRVRDHGVEFPILARELAVGGK